MVYQIAFLVSFGLFILTIVVNYTISTKIFIFILSLFAFSFGLSKRQEEYYNNTFSSLSADSGV